jgi:nitric oxide reductase activation protein
LRKTPDSEESLSRGSDDIGETDSTDIGEDGLPKYHQLKLEDNSLDLKKEKEFRKKLNLEARRVVSGSIHKNVKLIVHRPTWDLEDKEEYIKFSKDVMPVVREIARKTKPLLEHEISSEFARNHFYGSKFQSDSVAYKDFRYFSKKRPPNESPSLVVGLRVDESASMTAFGRLDAAKRAVVAVYEFCKMCDIPVLVYGDTADVSKLEQMSLFAYSDFQKNDYNNRYRIMKIRGRSNNRDGMALRIIAERLISTSQQTKLLISISDGQPKAMDDYTGSKAIGDMKYTISEFERKGITFLAAAIGQDKEVIGDIYGKDRFLDITNLNEFPAKLVNIIARHM